MSGFRPFQHRRGWTQIPLNVLAELEGACRRGMHGKKKKSSLHNCSERSEMQICSSAEHFPVKNLTKLLVPSVTLRVAESHFRNSNVATDAGMNPDRGAGCCRQKWN